MPPVITALAGICIGKLRINGARARDWPHSHSLSKPVTAQPWYLFLPLECFNESLSPSCFSRQRAPVCAESIIEFINGKTAERKCDYSYIQPFQRCSPLEDKKGIRLITFQLIYRVSRAIEISREVAI